MTVDEWKAWSGPIVERLRKALPFMSEHEIWAYQHSGWNQNYVGPDARIEVKSRPYDVRSQTYKIPTKLTGEALEKKLDTIIAKCVEREIQGEKNHQAHNRAYAARRTAEQFRSEYHAKHGFDDAPLCVSVYGEGNSPANYRATVKFTGLTAEQVKALIERFKEFEVAK